MPYYQADLIFPADRAPIRGGYVRLDDGGRVVELGERVPSGVSPERLRGALVPGFVNAHCHLELSHLRGAVDTGTGLLPFLRGVVTLRAAEPSAIQEAIRRADAAMWDAGIQAVGDIANTADAAAVKHASPIAYVTFVEAFDFLQGGAMAQEVLAKAEAVLAAHPEPRRLVPHAPYTVSPALHRLLAARNPPGGCVSIHNQETAAEDAFLRDGTGDFVGFYRDFGFDLTGWSPSGKTALAATLPYLDPARRTLFVHNTQTTPADLEQAEEWSERVYWVTCPNANLYIENRLPRYAEWVEAGARVAIGTDSLTSNWQLDIVEEMKAIQRYQSQLDTRTLVQWATLNGAEALGLDARIGSLSPGKVPGLVLIEGIDEMGRLAAGSRARRLV